MVKELYVRESTFSNYQSKQLIASHYSAVLCVAYGSACDPNIWHVKQTV